MSINLYQEAIVEAKQLREMAEQNAKNKIIDAVTPKIRELIEQQLMGDEEESELIVGNNVELEDEILDPEAPEEEEEEVLDLSSMDSVEAVADELIDDEAESDESVPVSITVQNVQGDINMNLEESDNDEDILLSQEGMIHLQSFLKEYSKNKSVDRRLRLLENKVAEFKKDLSGLNLNKIKPVHRQIVATYYASLLREVNLLTNQVIFINESVDERLEKRLLLTLKEIKNMSNRRDASIFRRLFEELAADEGLHEMGLSEQDEEVEVAEEAEEEVEVAAEPDMGAAEDALLDLGAALGLEVEVEQGEEEVEEDEDEEVDLELEEGDHADEMDEVYEIDESAIRRELRRIRLMREQEEGRAAEADPALAHGGEDEGDVLVDVSEEDLINALADELGDPGVPVPTVESRRRRNRRTAPRRRRVNEARRARALHGRAMKAEKTANHLRKQLQEMNLFNAKLLFANKLMQNRDLSNKQQRTIVEALDKATNIREAKLLYKSLSSSLNKSRGRGSLTESRTRLLASSSRSTRSGSPASNGSDVDRWALLAGLPDKK